MNAKSTLRRFRISILIAVLLATQMIAVTHTVAHVLHEQTGKCFVCHSADNFKHFTLATGVEDASSIAPERVVTQATTQPAYRLERAFFARGPPPISN